MQFISSSTTKNGLDSLVEPESNPQLQFQFDTATVRPMIVKPELSAPDSATQTSWTELVENIASQQQNAMEKLYLHFGKGVRLLIARQLGFQDVDDHVQDVFLITISAIQRGELHSPDCLPGFIRTVTKRKIAGQISKSVWKRNKEVDTDSDLVLVSPRKSPEEAAIDSENVRIMQAVLNEIHPRDREILTRFYLQNQSMETICQEMQMTETQFRLTKCRAKARFSEYGRRKLAKRELLPNSQRIWCSA